MTKAESVNVAYHRSLVLCVVASKIPISDVMAKTSVVSSLAPTHRPCHASQIAQTINTGIRKMITFVLIPPDFPAAQYVAEA